MSTDRRYLRGLALVIGVLVILGIVGGALSLGQGPRVSAVAVDPAAAVQASGSRLVFTVNQAVGEVDPSQVTVTPAIPFTVDTAGRNVGVRFTAPLEDATEYTVGITDVRGVSGGPSGELEASFSTPAAEVFLLRRGESSDSIFRTTIGSDRVLPVFTHAEIDDFRRSGDSLVISLVEDERSRLVVTDLDGENARDLPLPGPGTIAGLQVSDRGDYVGYAFSDADLAGGEGLASVLHVGTLAGGEPRAFDVAGEPAQVAEWRFVPDSSAALFIDFAGQLLLAEPDAAPAPLGNAVSIDGISRGTYQAIVQRASEIVLLDLTTGTETPVVIPELDGARADRVLPLPDGTNLWRYVGLDDAGMPTGQLIVRDDAIIADVSTPDTTIQVCTSPSGRDIALTIAPNLIDNPYDGHLHPLPSTLVTTVIRVEDGTVRATYDGFALSWCTMAP